ncbi:MAG: NAD(P)/FAD-dependent oxidoreductase [Candidatus Helarchaeota archaeon]
MFDVIISGAGLAGATAGEILAKAGHEVVIFDKNKFPWRKPCGGGIPNKCIKEFNISKKVVARIIEGLLLRAANGKELEIRYGSYTDGSDYYDYVVDRKEFDQYIRDRASDAGAQIEAQSPVVGLLSKNGNISGVKIRTKDGSIKEVNSKIVIAADGIGSQTVIEAGLRKKWKKNDYAICSVAIVSGYIEDSTLDQLILSNDLAPNSYAWLFPMNNQRANIGIGIWRTTGTNPMDYLMKFLNQDFMKKKFQSPKIIWKHNYPVPINGIKGKTYGNGILSVGDASGFVSPMIGEGIHYAFITGKLAAETAIKSLESGDYSKKFLKKYQDAWMDREIKQNFAKQSLIRELLLIDLEKHSNLLVEWATLKPENKNFFANMFIEGLEISDDMIQRMSQEFMDFINKSKTSG